MTSLLKRTPLYLAHTQSNARMIDFGGWEMPVAYGSQIEEHHAVRRDAGMFDVSHMRVLDLRGERTRDFLRYVLANNVDKLKTTGKALYSCMLTPDAGVIDDLIVYYFAEDFFRLVVNAGTAEQDIEWLNLQNVEGHFDITIEARTDMALIAVQGPNARQKVSDAVPNLKQVSLALKPFNACLIDSEDGQWMVARTGYTGEDGFEIALPSHIAEQTWQKLKSAEIRPAGLGARDTLRLEAGMNLYGADMDQTINPLDAGLGWTIDMESPRDFIGKKTLSQYQVQHLFLGLIMEGQGICRAHQSVNTVHGEGEITSGGFSPTMEKSIAMARLPIGVSFGDQIQVIIRDRSYPARVVALPFVRNGKIINQTP